MDTANEIVKLLSGALTPVIAIIAAYIAWRQHKTAQSKLKLDLYDRRFKVYRGLIDLLAAVLRDGKVSQDDLAKYYVDTNEKKFLFDDDIVAYMTEVREKVVDLRQVDRRIESLSRDREEQLSRLCDQESELLQWFDEQQELASLKFEKYLGFKHNL